MRKEEVQTISPVYIGWYDTKECPHFSNDESYGKRMVKHYELEYIVSSRSGYIVTDDIPVQLLLLISYAKFSLYSIR